MKEYDVIAVGTGSVMSIVSALFTDEGPPPKVAVIEKDPPGGICLTRGCIPSKLILYPAEQISKIEEAKKFGIDVQIKGIDFSYIMDRMRKKIGKDIHDIEKGLYNNKHIDFYPYVGTFVDEYTMKIKDEVIHGKKIILCSGSRSLIPPIKGLEKTHYLTSESFLQLKELPKKIVVIGGGYIAAEYGFFLSKMGADVTIVGRNPQFVPGEEPKISLLLKHKLSKNIKIHTGYEVISTVEKKGKKMVSAKKYDGEIIRIFADDILVATGRESNSDILRPENTGVDVDKNGWIKVNDYMETSKSNIWALGDAIGKHMFKHVANHEAEVVYRNAFGNNKKIKVDYHAVPHAIFTYPEVASVGMKEKEAKERTDVLIGHQKYEDTAKGDAMEVEDCFVKVIVEKGTYRILGVHIIGPQASILIQEIINLMYTAAENMIPIYKGMHIHPALSEVVQRAFSNLHEH